MSRPTPWMASAILSVIGFWTKPRKARPLSDRYQLPGCSDVCAFKGCRTDIIERKSRQTTPACFSCRAFAIRHREGMGEVWHPSPPQQQNLAFIARISAAIVARPTRDIMCHGRPASVSNRTRTFAFNFDHPISPSAAFDIRQTEVWPAEAGVSGLTRSERGQDCRSLSYRIARPWRRSRVWW